MAMLSQLEAGIERYLITTLKKKYFKMVNRHLCLYIFLDIILIKVIFTL